MSRRGFFALQCRWVGKNNYVWYYKMHPPPVWSDFFWASEKKEWMQFPREIKDGHQGLGISLSTGLAHQNTRLFPRKKKNMIKFIGINEPCVYYFIAAYKVAAERRQFAYFDLLSSFWSLPPLQLFSLDETRKSLSALSEHDHFPLAR